MVEATSRRRSCQYQHSLRNPRTTTRIHSPCPNRHHWSGSQWPEHDPHPTKFPHQLLPHASTKRTPKSEAPGTKTDTRAANAISRLTITNIPGNRIQAGVPSLARRRRLKLISVGFVRRRVLEARSRRSIGWWRRGGMRKGFGS